MLLIVAFLFPLEQVHTSYQVDRGAHLYSLIPCYL